MVAVQSGSSSLLNHQSPLYTACGTLKPVRPLPSPNCPWTSKNPSWLFYSGPNPIINGKGTGPQILFYVKILIACILPHFQQFSALLSKTLKVTNHVYLYSLLQSVSAIFNSCMLAIHFQDCISSPPNTNFEILDFFS